MTLTQYLYSYYNISVQDQSLEHNTGCLLDLENHESKPLGLENHALSNKFP